MLSVAVVAAALPLRTAAVKCTLASEQCAAFSELFARGGAWTKFCAANNPCGCREHWPCSESARSRLVERLCAAQCHLEPRQLNEGSEAEAEGEGTAQSEGGSEHHAEYGVSLSGAATHASKNWWEPACARCRLNSHTPPGLGPPLHHLALRVAQMRTTRWTQKESPSMPG